MKKKVLLLFITPFLSFLLVYGQNTTVTLNQSRLNNTSDDWTFAGSLSSDLTQIWISSSGGNQFTVSSTSGAAFNLESIKASPSLQGNFQFEIYPTNNYGAKVTSPLITSLGQTVTATAQFSNINSFTINVTQGPPNYLNFLSFEMSPVPNAVPTATNLTQAKSATEGGSTVALTDIVVADADAGETITASLTLSSAAAGSLSTGTYGSATSTFNAGTGVWTVTGSVSDVNAALAAVAFTPSANHDQNFTITTRIRDAAASGPADGTISFTVTGVNDAPTATNLTQTKSANERGSTVALDDIVVTDPDAGETITATLTLSSTVAGSLSTGTYGSATSTFTAGTGVWTVTGSVTDVNAALAAVAFTPSANNDQNFTITVRIRDVANTGPADGTISFAVTPAFDAPIITSVLPLSAKPGDQVVITGNYFHNTKAGNIVFFGATQANVTLATVSSLTVEVPSGATYGPVTVLNTVTNLLGQSSTNFNPVYSPVKTSVSASDFGSKTDLTTAVRPYSLAVGDVNGDFLPDIVVANLGAASVSIFQNTGTISGKPGFGAKVDLTVNGSPINVAVGDLNGDGKPEIVTAHTASSNISVLQNTSNGSLSFAAYQSFNAGATNYSVAIGDLDGDGKPELVSANLNNTLGVLKNATTNGILSFPSYVHYPAHTQPLSVVIADLDGDGKRDVALANGNSDDISVYRNTSTVGNISLAAKVDFTTGDRPFYVAQADLNGDDKPELITANYGSNNVSVFQNISSPGSINFSTRADFSTGFWPLSIATGDIDGDGRPDLAVANQAGNSISLLSNTGTGGNISFANKIDISTTNSPYAIALGDVDGNQVSDLLVALENQNMLYVFPGNAVPAATNLTQSKTATEGGSAVALDDIVVSDADGSETISATLTLSSTAAGSLSTGTYGAATSTFNAGTGVWTITGSVTDVNAALAAVAFTPSADNDQNFSITTRIRDVANTGPADGTISFTVTAVNNPTVTTASATSVGATSAKLGGNVSSDGGATITERGIVWNLTGSPTTADHKVADAAAGTGIFSNTIGLPSGTKIYVKAFATNSEGTAYGSEIEVTTPSATPPGNALAFNGGQSVVINPAGSAATNFGGSSSFTIEAWIKPASFAGNPALFGHKNMGTPSTGYCLFLLGGGNLYLEGTGSGTGSQAKVETGKWNHVAVTFDYAGTGTSGVATFYLNGEEVGSNTLNISSTSASARIGAFSDGSYRYNGDIDELKVWNTVRTQGQIQAGMTSMATLASPNLVAYYHFDQGIPEGTNTALDTLYDQSTNGYHGTLSGFALSGALSNWKGSYAMVAPVAAAASDVKANAFTANWTAPVNGTSDSYLLDVSANRYFNSFVSGYQGKDVGVALSEEVTGLNPGTTYYYRVRAKADGVTGGASATIAVTILSLAPDANGVLYVNKSVSAGNGKGNSWTNALTELADALKLAKANTDVKEIWVAKGKYTPLYSPKDGANFANEGRDNTFLLVNNVKIYGGFAGTETALSERNLNAGNETILSGDIDHNDGADGTIVGANAYHIVVGSGAVGAARLDGFTITGGYAHGVNNITVKGNGVDPELGGGINLQSFSSPALQHLKITKNSGEYGSAISTNFNCSPLMEGVEISYNSSAIYGAIYNVRSSPKLMNSSIHHNHSGNFGAPAMFNMYAESQVELINVTVANNTTAGSRPALYNDDGTLKISNSIIWGNSNGAFGGNTTNTVSNSIVQGGYSGTNVLNKDPKFTDATNGDYRLQTTSLAINAGDNTLFTGLSATSKDLAGNARVYDYAGSGVIDMGAFELQSEPLAFVTKVAVPNDGTYIVGQLLKFNISFNQEVTVAGTPRLGLTVGTETRYASYTSGSTTNELLFQYEIQSGDIDADGIAIVALSLNGGSIKDASSIAADLTLDEVGATNAILVDGKLPTITGVTSSKANGTYKTGDAISIQVSFSESVTVTGTPQLTLETGTTDRATDYSSGSGTSTLTFTYTVQAGDSSSDLDYSATTALALNGGTIKDAAGNSATLTLPSPGATNSLGDNKAIVVDGIAPTLAITSNAGTLKKGETATITFTFSEDPGATFTWDGSAGDVTVSGGTLGAISGTGSSRTATFTPTADTNNGTASISVVAGSYADAAGNSGAAGTTPSLTFDTEVPVAPTGLAVVAGNGQNVLSWTASTETDLAGYKVYGGSATGPTTLLQTVNEPTVTYADTDLTNGTAYYYRITAVDVAGNESSYSSEQSATPQGPQTITFSALPSTTYGDADFAPGATASSGLTVSYTSDNTAVATIVSGKIHIVGAGTANITASQAGDVEWLAATDQTQQLTVDKKALAVTATASDKVYDGNTTATVTLSDDRVTGDVLTATNTTATFDNKKVGDGKTVTVSGITISGTDAGNYTVNTGTTTTADITAKTLVVSASAEDKVYDGNNTATVTLSDDRVTGDVLTATNTTATFDNKKVGNGKTVTVSGITISGTDAGNYTVNTGTTTTADITAKALAVTAMASDKVYDGNTAATVTLNDDRVTDDVLTATNTTATFDNKKVGNGKTVTVSGITISGTDAGNYTVNTGTTATADITAKTLVVSASAEDKVYDGSTTATVTLSDDRVTGDVLTATNTTATFDNKKVGNGKTVTVSGITISGTDAGNYTVNTGTTATADITAKALVVTATASDKVYDGNTAATVTLSDDRVSGDVLTATNTTATFDNKKVGNGKTVTVSGITISGTDAGNYTANTGTTATADITAKALAVTATASDKVYDGNTTATVTLSDDRVSGDVLTATNTTATFDNKKVGNGKTVTVSGITISGTDAGNYTVNTGTTTTADITVKALAVTATAEDKVYDGNTTATITLNDDRVGGDVLTAVNTTATFDSKNIGTNKTVTVSGISISGTDAGNYTVNTTTSTTADITAKALAVTATASDKVYDGNTTATVTLSDDRVSGDVLTTTNTAATFDNKNVGTAKTVTVSGISISGTDADNYTVNTTTTATADITAKALAVTATASDKVYDGNTTASISLSDDRVSGDVLTVTNTTATFDNKNVGTGKTVTISGITISGTDAGNYTVNTGTTTTADITAKTLVVSASAEDKVYDGNTTATVTLSDDRVGGDVLTAVNTTATFDSKNIGTNKTVTVSGITISGADAGNYTVNTGTTATANITAKALTITADDKEKFEGEANPVLTVSYEGFITGEDSSVLTVQPDISTTATTASLQGTYPITASGASAQNYGISYVEGTLTVKPGAPTSVSLTGISLYENRPAGTPAGTLGSTSDSPTATFTYSLVSGSGDTDNAGFAINGNQLVTAGPLNYETKESYSIRVRNTTQYGFSLDEVFTVQLSDVNEVPTLDAVADQTICYTTGRQDIALTGITAGPDAGQSVTVTATASNSALLSDLSISNNNELRYRVADGQSGTTMVTVTVKDNGGTLNGGADETSRTFVITVNALPQITISSDKGNSVSKGETAVLTATSDNGVAYSWSSADGIIDGQNTAVLTVRPLETTTYSVRVTSASGCESVSNFTVNVADDFRALRAENFITPNGDGQNDTWVVHNIDAYPDHTLVIVDRAGRKVYQTRNYRNDWAGTAEGAPLDGGTYYYIFRFDEAGIAPKKGFITVVRQGQ